MVRSECGGIWACFCDALLMGWRARKRVFDICLAAVLLAPVVVVGAVVGVLIWALDGRPVFFFSERMRTPDQAFQLIKFRTMIPAPCDGGVMGGDKAARVTRLGRVLRRTRLDELPQIMNILRGQISFVGPRPPVRKYVEAHPQLYAQVLSVPVGVTGAATLYFHAREARMLAACPTRRAAETLYRTHCVPLKARLDRAYARRRTLWRDAVLVALTGLAVAGIDPACLRRWLARLRPALRRSVQFPGVSKQTARPGSVVPPKPKANGRTAAAG